VLLMGKQRPLSGAKSLSKEWKDSPAGERWIPHGVVWNIPVLCIGCQAPAKRLSVFWCYTAFYLDGEKTSQKNPDKSRSVFLPEKTKESDPYRGSRW
jgi:hypothetical protein